MIKSMTGFARAEKTAGTMGCRVEIRSYNGKSLDVVLRIPQNYLALEEKIKALASEHMTRGRLEIRFQVEDQAPESFGFTVDFSVARAFHQALVELQEDLNLKADVPLNMIASAEGVIRPRDADRDMESAWEIFRDCLEDALNAHDEMRAREGAFLAEDFRKRMDFIESSTDAVEAAAAGLAAGYQHRLQERISALTSGLVEIDPGRIAQEAAFLADRSDISEEIVRTRSHIEQFRRIVEAAEPSGRKLNFLLQEFNREFNTMGAKAGSAPISHIIVAVKTELEKIREQVQNIE